MKKRDFLSKISVKDYNNQLEEILEKKKFSGNVKNLLLSMFYKVELGYKDYKTVKRTSITQKQIIEEIMDLIQYECEDIELVEPGSKKGKILAGFGMASVTNPKDKTIISYPIEKELLYALSNLTETSFYVGDDYYLIKDTLPIILKMGHSIENKEIIRDFNGWSWDIANKDIDNYQYNLIYQNLRILINSDFLYRWYKDQEKQKDYMLELKEELEKQYGVEISQKFYKLFCLLCIILNMNEDKRIKQDILEEQQKVSKDKKIMLDRTKFLEKISQEKKNIHAKIMQIDKMLNSKDALEKELERRNKSKLDKVADIDSLKFVLRNKRKKMMDELKKFTKLMDPKLYGKNVEELNKKHETLNTIDVYMVSNEWISEKTIELQKIFLDAIKTRIENAKTKAEIIELIYHFRYYKKIAVTENLKIEDIEELKFIINNIEELLIVKGINTKALNILTKNANYNILISKKAINSKIVNLDNAQIEIKAKYSKLQVYIYDGEIQEEMFEIETSGSAEKVELKMKRKAKLFG